MYIVMPVSFTAVAHDELLAACHGGAHTGALHCFKLMAFGRQSIRSCNAYRHGSSVFNCKLVYRRRLQLTHQWC